MAIHPIDFRYGTAEMKAEWSEEARLDAILRVEAALAKAEADVGLIPREAAEAIEKAIGKVEVDRVNEIEDEIKHDMMAVVLAISEHAGDHGKWVHFGATSNDILDSATGLQIKNSLEILEDKIIRLRAALLDRAEEHKHTVAVGRTHGQIAVPTTYGLRFAIWASEVDRHLQRLRELRPRVVVGQMSGAVGTQAAFGPRGMEIKDRAMEYLGLEAVDVSSQIIQRDRYAELIMWMANLVTSLDKIAIEIRSLQRSEIGEVEEAFGKDQVGSSTMPHKRNPIKSEQIGGLSRIVRAMVDPALMNNTLWDERDLTNSSAERITFPESFVLTDHLVNICIGVIEGLRFYPENIRRNLELLKGLNMGEAVMLQLALKGVGRQEAHAIIRENAMKAHEEGRHFTEVLKEDPRVTEHLSPGEVEETMEPENYIGTAVEQVERLVEKLRD